MLVHHEPTTTTTTTTPTPTTIISKIQKKYDHIIHSTHTFSKIKNNSLHSQLRNTIKFIEGTSEIYYMFQNYLYSLNIYTHDIRIIIDMNNSNVDEFSEIRGERLDVRMEVYCFCKSEKYLFIGLAGKKESILIKEAKGEERKIVKVKIVNGYEMNAAVISQSEKILLCVAQSYTFFVYKIHDDDGVSGNMRLSLIYEYDLKNYAGDVEISKNEKYACVVTDRKGYYVFNIDKEYKFKMVYNRVINDHCTFANFNCTSTKLIVCNKENLRMFDLKKMVEERVFVLPVICSVCKFSPVNENVFVALTGSYYHDYTIVPEFLYLGDYHSESKFTFYEIDKYLGQPKTRGLCFNDKGSKVFISIGDNHNEYRAEYHEGDKIVQYNLNRCFYSMKSLDFKLKMLGNIEFINTIIKCEM